MTEPHLWRRAQAMFARAALALGGAAAIAAQVLDRASRREILGWIAPLECIVRKLLLVEAAALSRTEAAHARKAPRMEIIPCAGLGMARHATTVEANRSPSPRGEGAGSGVNHDASPPHFAFALPQPQQTRNANAPRIRMLLHEPRPAQAPPAPHARTEPALHFARRFEALRRVLDDPMPHVRRFARRLKAARRRIAGLVTRPADDRVGRLAQRPTIRAW